MAVDIRIGDCREVLADIGAQFDSCVTDPPYHLTSIVKRFGKEGSAPVKVSEFYKANGESKGSSPYARSSAGFMGKQWDGGGVAFEPETWRAVYDVLKPGAHLVAFGGTRTYHRMVCAIEDAGFEIRDQLAWVYGSGFPKSHDVAKGIDKAAGAEREKIGEDRNFGKSRLCDGKNAFGDFAGQWDITAPATDAAKQWQGWGTALKPAWEPIVLARKPLVSTVAQNVLQHGTGALNIDGCRVETNENLNGGAYSGQERRRDEYSSTDTAEGAVPLSRLNRGVGEYEQPAGRWPANIVHDGSEEVVGAFPDDAGGRDHRKGLEPGLRPSGFVNIGHASGDDRPNGALYADSGSAARFFYCAKADKEDRAGSKHPTVKPLALMRWLVRLVTPPGGLVLDPFAGTGTTGQAALEEGMRAVLVERETEYVADIERRMAQPIQIGGLV